VAARVDGQPVPLELGRSIPRKCQAVVAHVVIAMLAIGIPLAAPVLTHRALMTIRSDHAGSVAAGVVHSDARTRVATEARNQSSGPRIDPAARM